MRPHKKPDFSYDVDLSAELEHIGKHQVHRKIPDASDNNLLIVMWNSANFGLAS